VVAVGAGPPSVPVPEHQALQNGGEGCYSDPGSNLGVNFAPTNFYGKSILQ